MCRTKTLSRLLLPTHQLKLQLLLRVKNTSLLLTACSCRTSHDIRISYNRNFFPMYSQHITRTSSKATRVATFRNLKPFQAVFTLQRFWQKCIPIVFPVRLFLTYLHDSACIQKWEGSSPIIIISMWLSYDCYARHVHCSSLVTMPPKKKSSKKDFA